MSFISRERRRVAKRSRVSQMVYGGQDGVTTSVGLVSSLFAATHSNSIVLIAGASAALAGVFSMAAGAYLSTRAQSDLHRSELAREREKIRTEPENELDELRKIYERHGMAARLASQAAESVIRKPRKVLEVMAQAELGIDANPRQDPVADALVTSASFLCAALVPLLPYAFLHGLSAFFTAAALAAIALLCIGVLKGTLTGSNRLRSGLETFVLGALATALGFIVGTLIPKALGIHVPAA